MYKKKIEKRKKIIALIVSIILLFIFSFKFNKLSSEGIKIDSNNLEFSIPSNPIEIDDLGSNDWTWAVSQPWFGGGSGVSGDPYILEDLVIDGEDMDDCIKIENSKAHFIIQNCTLYNSAPGMHTGAITLINVTNGNVIDNNISNNYYAGIYGNNINYTQISKNIISYSYGYGVYLDNCYYNDVLNNEVYKTTVGYGIDLEDSPNNKVEGNEIKDCIGGIEVDHSNHTTVVGNIAEDNEKRGIYIYYSDNCDITDNIFENNTMSGIYLTGSSFNTISDNIARDNTLHGIALEPYYPAHCNSNIITNNLLNHNNISGIYLFNASNNHILNNEISDNQIIGAAISPDSDNNLMSYNFFLRNEKHAIDYGANNDWNSLTIGNYWDNYTGSDADNDGIGDTPHDIPGDANSTDDLPIWDERAPIIDIITPLNNSKIGSTAPEFAVEIYDPYLDIMWYTIDDGTTNITFTANGTIDQTNWETLWESLAKGDTITIMFYANDTFGHLGFNFIEVIKKVPSKVIGLDFFTTSFFILMISGVAIIVIITKLHYKKRIIQN